MGQEENEDSQDFSYILICTVSTAYIYYVLASQIQW